MKKLKIAVLEDSDLLLRDLIETIQQLGLADVITYSINTTDFIQKVKQNGTIEALVLDIDIVGDAMNGIDVCNYLGLPTLFISGKTKDYIDKIENVKIFNEQPIDFLTKPIREDKLKLVFSKFEKQVYSFKKELFIELKFISGFKESIKQSEIVLFEGISGSTSNNKRVYLTTDSNPKEISKSSFNSLFEKGLCKDNFVEVHQSFLVNKNYLGTINRRETEHLISYTIDGAKKEVKIDLSKRYLEKIRKY